MHQALRDNGFTVISRRSAPAHIDRLAAWNRKLKDATGKTAMTISPRCKHLIADCERTERLADGSIDKKKHDPHALDAASYAVEYQWPANYATAQVLRRWS